MPNVSIRTLIADDHSVMRRLSRALRAIRAAWKVCGEAENGQDIVTALLNKKSQGTKTLVDQWFTKRGGLFK
jgi:DNA-binding NarL/FixJ family response regulator